jgi:hypothetical protein
VAKHRPDITSQAVARHNQLKTVDEQLTRLSRSYRLNPNAAMLDAIDDLLDQRSGLSCSLGEMLSAEDRARLSEWGEADTGQAA